MLTKVTVLAACLAISQTAAASQTGTDARDPDRDCTIKGNISPDGMIYHMPGQRDYSRTRISEKNGERWFCTEDEAVAAGWRRATR